MSSCKEEGLIRDESRITGVAIVVAEACAVFVWWMFPRYDIQSIKLGHSVMDKGYYPTFRIAPTGDPFGEESLEIQLNVWTGDDPFIKYKGMRIDLIRCEHGGFNLCGRDCKCPKCDGTDVGFGTIDPGSNHQMTCSNCQFEGFLEEFMD